MKRRNMLALLGGTGALVAGLGIYQWQKENRVLHSNLKDFNPDDEVDFCIIGSGPAGCTLAQNLKDNGNRVLMVESGSSIEDSRGMQAVSKLDKYSSSGVLDYPLQATRLRAIGGTSNIWTGRCPRMLPSDFVDNPLIQGNQWPINYAELQPFYRRAEKSLSVVAGKLGPSHAPREYDLPGPTENIEELQAILSPHGIFVDYPPVSSKRLLYFKSLGPIRFSKDVVPALSQGEKISIISEATATRILTNTQGDVTGIKLQSLDGTEKVVQAAKYIVACGAVESIRLLMLSRDKNYPDGIGNHADYLGKYFMEHPWKGYNANIEMDKDFSEFNLGRTYQYCSELKKRNLGGAILGFYTTPPKNLRIELGIEVAPFPENRINLNKDNPDAFGNPGANIQINFSAKDHELWNAGEAIINDIFKILNSDSINKRDKVKWSHHHMGGTRMSHDSSNGVVDENLKVHQTNNLYVASSSVFVSSGVANPTLTIVALAHRLSDHLSKNS